jgi:hypothetical protein
MHHQDLTLKNAQINPFAADETKKKTADQRHVRVQEFGAQHLRSEQEKENEIQSKEQDDCRSQQQMAAQNHRAGFYI